MIWKVVRTAKRFENKIEQIQLVEREDDYVIIHDYVVDGFYVNQRLWSAHLTRGEAHKAFNLYLNIGYTEISEDK